MVKLGICAKESGVGFVGVLGKPLIKAQLPATSKLNVQSTRIFQPLGTKRTLANDFKFKRLNSASK